MRNPNLAAECKEKIETCATMIAAYHRQGVALVKAGDLDGAKKAFNVAIEVSDSMLATCDVATRYRVHFEDVDPETLATVVGITRTFRAECVDYIETISTLMAADPDRYAAELPASGIRERS